MNIIEAVKDRHLFKPYLADKNGSLSTWARWMTCLRVIYGLPIRKPWQKRLIRQCTGRNPDKLNPEGYNRVLLLCGRRSGKSKIAGLIGAFESSLSGREEVCSPGEIPCVTITSPTRDQSAIIKSYLRAALGSPLLDETVVDEAKKRPSFELANGVHVRVLTGDFRTVRGYSQLAVVCDEICFFGTTEESKVKSDTELIRSIKPSLLTTQGRLICVSSKYWEKGWAFGQWKRHFGKDSSRVLVWDATSRTMNPTLSEEDIQAEIDEDPESARSEYLNVWRTDVAAWLPREAIEPCVVFGRTELIRKPNISYRAFVDVSGGRSDDAALAISHKADSKTVLDCVRRWKAPFSPQVVVADMVDVLKSYQLRHVTGDNYSAEWVAESFRKLGISYVKSDKNKSQIYLELLPRICSGEVELLDDDVLIKQLCGLERRCRSGGKDIVDHAPGAKDDVANAAAGAIVFGSKGHFQPGFIIRDRFNGGRTLRNRVLWGEFAKSHRATF
ncbi:MAG: hypothetical protein JW993_18320 [Sedimentisphaerales bacterium]|nr:hypothetical protein [Sedimentisphaerales bacterium]